MDQTEVLSGKPMFLLVSKATGSATLAVKASDQDKVFYDAKPVLASDFDNGVVFVQQIHAYKTKTGDLVEHDIVTNIVKTVQCYRLGFIASGSLQIQPLGILKPGQILVKESDAASPRLADETILMFFDDPDEEKTPEDKAPFDIPPPSQNGEEKPKAEEVKTAAKTNKKK